MKDRACLIGSFILLGLVGLIAQAICIRESLVIYFGNELTIGIILASWLLGIAAGAFLASWFVDKTRLPLINLYCLLLIIFSLLWPVQIYLIRLTRHFLNAPIGEHISFLSLLLTNFLLIIPLSLVLGLVFPLACRIYRSYTGAKEPAIGIGRVYILEALGSLAGGVIFTFCLAGYFHSFSIITMTNLTLLIIVFGLLSTNIKISHVLKAICLLLIMVNIYGLADGANRLDKFSLNQRWHGFAPNVELVETIDSRYQNLALGQIGNQYNLYTNGQFTTSFPDEYTYAPLAHLWMVEHPNPQKVLLIGGGLEGLIKEILRHPVRQLHYVQLDPAIIDLVLDHLPPEDQQLIKGETNKRLFIHYQDGRYFVKHTSEQFDLVLINLADPATAMINRFYTQDFFHEVKRILKPNGAIITRANSAVNYFGKEIGDYLGSLYDTLNHEFRYVLVSPGTRSHLFACNRDGIITLDVDTLTQRYQSRRIDTPYFTVPAQYESLLSPWHVQFVTKALRGRTQHYLNTDLQPITYYFNLVLWDTITRDKLTKSISFFKNLARIKFSWLIGFLIIILVFRLFYLGLKRNNPLRHQRLNSLWTVFSLGFSGMTLELVILFAFQNIYGYLYQAIGLLIALFMLGLALGALTVNKLVSLSQPTDRGLKRYTGTRLLTGISLATALFALIIPLSVAFTPYLFWLLIILAGGLVGSVYPLAGKLYLTAQTKTTDAIGQTAGLIDAADHLGAFIGAMLTGLLLVPLFGIFNTCLFVALINIVSLIILLVTPKQP